MLNWDSKIKIIFMVVGLLGIAYSLPAAASYMPFNQKVNLKIGIGTTMISNAGLTLMSGNVGIGTWVPGSALNVVGNVGIGSTAPNGAVDVGAGSICLGHICYSIWMSGGTNDWSLTGGTGNVGISTTNTVGIGTTSGVESRISGGQR